MLTEQRLHEQTHRIAEIVFAQSLDTRQLQHFFALEIVLLKRGLLQDFHQDLQSLIHLAAQAIDDEPEEVGLVHDLNSGSRILQASRDVFGIESLRAADGGAQHQFSDAGVLCRLI